MTKAVRVTDDVYEKLNRFREEHGVSMAEAASMLFDAERSTDSVLLTQAELDRMLDREAEIARNAAIDGYRHGFKEQYREAALASDTGAVKFDADLDEDSALLVADEDRFLEAVRQAVAKDQ